MVYQELNSYEYQLKKELLQVYFLARMARMAEEKRNSSESYWPEAQKYFQAAYGFKHPLAELPKMPGTCRPYRDAFMAACQDVRLYYSPQEMQLKKEVCLSIFPDWEEGSRRWEESNFWEI